MKTDIIPIFPIPLIQINNFLTDEECNSLLDEVATLEYYRPFDAYTQKYKTTTYSTNDNDYLRKHQPWLQDRLEKEFTKISKDIGNEESLEFAVCSSWVTCTIPGGYSRVHSHANSYFSAVMYLQENITPIKFYKGTPRGMDFDISEKTEFNVNQLSVNPSKGGCLLFPSYLDHSVAQNLNPTLRYSISANFFPIGTWGRHDSTVNTSIHPHVSKPT